ncbi:MAG TPA: undecaprenyl-phosphate glucose phosphotransferase [Leptospiraceae bacterium]|nr:undecaprenyl-phosphate glucose phosphotransferase [Leptospiraceae bacterium]
MLKERNQTFKLIFIFMDFFIAALSFGAAFSIRYFLQDSERNLLQYLSAESYLLLGALLSGTQILAFLGVDLYHPRRGLSAAEEFFSIATGVVLNLVLILALLFFFREVSFSRLVIIYFTVINIILTAFVHYIFRYILMRLRERGYNLRKMIILGTGKNALKIRDIVARHLLYGYKISGFVSAEEISESLSYPVLGRMQDLENILSKERPDIVIYALGVNERNWLKDSIDLCDREGIELKIVPGFTEFIAARGRVEGMDGIPVISIRDIPVRYGYNLFLKRLFDIVFSLTFIIVFSPVYLLIAFFIKITSKGPVFIFQERIGLDHRKFRMIKFRSMIVQEKAASDTVWTTKDDPRVTGIGRIIRKTSLDEIPQFFNVLRGNMSVVGPRPERPHFVDQFRTEYSQYMRRHGVKGGITGWAQVQGLRGDTSIEERVAADIYYIENWSFFFDIKIILMTPLTGFINKNAY